MKQVLANLRDGTVQVRDVPAPSLREGFVLVRNHCSLISAGTEGATIRLGRMSPLDKVRARPEQALKLVQLAQAQGPLTAYRVAQRALDMPVALGYSSAGVVESIGTGVTGLFPGQRVACAGQGWASHAEFVIVPRRLCVPIPEGVGFEQAAFATVGAIALQSLRIVDPKLGETVVVIGLGLIGMLVCQLARANGCNVVGLDVDPQRIQLVREMKWGEAHSADSTAIGVVSGITGGHGADAVVITAATEDPGPVTLAGDLCRRKGRVVVLGRTPMIAPRETYLFKELSLHTSMALGAGTGDPLYESEGHDYPLPYVRFTEERNLCAFLEQIARGSVDVSRLTTHRFPIDSAVDAFSALESSASETRGIGVVLDYPGAGPIAEHRTVQRSVARNPVTTRRTVGLSVIGAGSFATHEFLPLLKGMDVRLRGVVSQTGIRAQAIAQTHGFEFSSSDANTIFEDTQTSAVMILTRHDSHAELARRALEARKHVFVEKPLALDLASLERVRIAHSNSGRVLMVGFNRRFAPLATRMKADFSSRTQPLILNYCANVGLRPPEHWLHHPTEGGGVIIGEACHHIDFCAWFVGTPLESFHCVQAGSSRTGTPVDNLCAVLRFKDGSIANISYLSNGSKRFPTETIDAFCAGHQARLIDFRTLELPGRWWLRRLHQRLAVDKGHRAQLRAFIDAAGNGEDLSSLAEEYFASSRLTIALSALANTGLMVPASDVEP